jgi:hypothetical protein
MGGTGAIIAVKARARAKPEPIVKVAQNVANVVLGQVEMLRKKRDFIVAAYREESDYWSKGPKDSVWIKFSDECDDIVKHSALMGLIRARDDVEAAIESAGYAVDGARSGSFGFVAPLRAATWGTTKSPGTRTLGGPFIASSTSEFGWEEVEVTRRRAQAPADPARRYAAMTGVCGCEMCVWSRRATVISPDTEKRTGRDAALKSTNDRLDELGPKRVAAATTALDRWSWSGSLPKAFADLQAELGRGGASVLELAAILAVRAA